MHSNLSQHLAAAQQQELLRRAAARRSTRPRRDRPSSRPRRLAGLVLIPDLKRSRP